MSMFLKMSSNESSNFANNSIAHKNKHGGACDPGVETLSLEIFPSEG